MARFSGAYDLQGATFVGTDLRGARFVESDLSGVVMRGVEVGSMEIDAPWLSDGDSPLRVNGVDVTGFVESELDRRFPGRSLRRATEPDGLREAWGALDRAWATTLRRVENMPASAVDVSVDGEWSFAQTLRHLVLATDLWWGQAVMGFERPFHPLGLTGPQVGAEGGLDLSAFSSGTPSFGEVLEARSGRVAMVRDFLATVTPADLSVARRNPWAPQRAETTLSCVHVILEEEWEHHRFAVRDLDAIVGSSAGRSEWAAP